VPLSKAGFFAASFNNDFLRSFFKGKDVFRSFFQSDDFFPAAFLLIVRFEESAEGVGEWVGVIWRGLGGAFRGGS